MQDYIRQMNSPALLKEQSAEELYAEILEEQNIARAEDGLEAIDHVE